jgi:hypothetical protein
LCLGKKHLEEQGIFIMAAIGGRDAKPGEFPHMVLYNRFSIMYFRIHYCLNAKIACFDQQTIYTKTSQEHKPLSTLQIRF